MDANTYESALEKMIMDNIGFAQLRGYFKVFYGTQEKAYCTTLEDCIKQLTS